MVEGWVEYSSNNSGGSWWLTDRDWQILEEAGWEVDWVRDQSDSLFGGSDPTRFLGSLAMGAKRYGVTVNMAKAEFEMLTGQTADDKGCSCCGQPHNFYKYDAEGNMHW
jgi:hypothetical protein